MASPADFGASLLSRWRVSTAAGTNSAAFTGSIANEGSGGAGALSAGVNDAPTFLTSGIGGLAALQFGATANTRLMSGGWFPNHTQPFTAYLIFQIDATGTGQPYWAWNMELNVAAGGLEVWTDSGFSATTPTRALPHVLAVTYNGASTEVRLDGSLHATGTVGTAGTGNDFLHVGNHATLARPFPGRIAELGTVNGAVTVADLNARVFSYAQDTYGINVGNAYVGGTADFYPQTGVTTVGWSAAGGAANTAAALDAGTATYATATGV